MQQNVWKVIGCTHTKGFFWNGAAPWTQVYFSGPSLLGQVLVLSQVFYYSPTGGSVIEALPPVSTPYILPS